MAKQPLKKKEVPSFNVKDFKKSILGEENSKVADKELEWILLPEAYQEAVKLPGIPQSRTSLIRGWSDVGKSTLKNCIIASAMKQGILPIVFETEGNFNFEYARDCGMDITPIYGKIEEEDPETGEMIEKDGIIDWEGNYFLFTNKGICDYCGDNDYSTGSKKPTKRKTPVIEDIGYIINDFIDKQEDGKIPMPLLFIWDSIGSIQSWKSLQSKVGNPMFDAGAISAVFKPIFSRIATTKELGMPYSNTLVGINKIWTDNVNSVGPAVSVENTGGKAWFYNSRLILHLGGTAKAGIKKLKATVKGEEYQYGTVTKISVVKNQLPTPYNLTRSSTMCCVHNGIISEEEINNYKKEFLPDIIGKIKEISNGKIGTISEKDVSFTEDGVVED